MTESPCGASGAVVSFGTLGTPDGPTQRRPGRGTGTGRMTGPKPARSSPGAPETARASPFRPPSIAAHTESRHRRMDAKQVWRAALGELQVSLSPANFETWLRDTMLVDVDENRFRIAVPNGFAKDWLESRYRSLISQTLARIVGYSVQVEFVVGTPPEAMTEAEPDGAPAPMAPERPLATPSSQHVRVRSEEHTSELQ